MRNTSKIISVFLAISLGTLAIPKKTFAQNATVSFQVFYDELSPYGQWIDYPSYGYVWRPDVEAGFSPYSTAGYWVLTDYGWTWVSDYSWGWAPFHYGRWNYDNSYGWLWIPQNEWGPAWVTWRQSDEYYGWAPMGYGITVSASFGSGYNVPHEHWRFVRGRDFHRRDLNNYYVDRSNNVTIINNTRVIQNTHEDKERHTTYVTGPRREEVQKVTGATIQPVAIRGNSKPGQNLKNNELEIYRPQVQARNAADQKIAPAKITKMEELKRAPQSNTENKTEKPNVPAVSNPNEHPAPPAKATNLNESKPVQERKPAEQQPANVPNNDNVKTQTPPANQNPSKSAPEKRSQNQQPVVPSGNGKPQPVPQAPVPQPQQPRPQPQQQQPRQQPQPQQQQQPQQQPKPQQQQQPRQQPQPKPQPQQPRQQQPRPQQNVRPPASQPQQQNQGGNQENKNR